MAERPLTRAMEYIVARAGELQGMRSAAKRPPDKITDYPFATAFPGTGTIGIGNPQGSRRDVHTIILEIHVARKDLPSDIDRVLPFVDLVGDKLQSDPTLGGTVTTIVGDISYTFGPLGWFGQETIGWQFQIPVKIIA
jgi:hypothetical protein